MTGGDDSDIRIWDSSSCTCLASLTGHEGWVYSVAFSSDGTQIVSSSGDCTVRLWDAATGALLRTFEGHTKRVLSVAITRDGRRIVSGGHDSVVRLWDSDTGTCPSYLRSIVRFRSCYQFFQEPFFAIFLQGFFQPSVKFRVPMFLATSSSRDFAQQLFCRRAFMVKSIWIASYGTMCVYVVEGVDISSAFSYSIEIMFAAHSRIDMSSCRLSMISLSVYGVRRANQPSCGTSNSIRCVLVSH